jgi:amino acid transporter
MTNAKLAGFITLLLVICCSINFFGVRWFGESEFWFALIKISLILGLIIGGLVVDLGGGPDGKRLGFTYWKHRELSSYFFFLRALNFYIACSWCFCCSPRPRKRRQVPWLVHLSPSVCFPPCIKPLATSDACITGLPTPSRAWKLSR